MESEGDEVYHLDHLGLLSVYALWASCGSGVVFYSQDTFEEVTHYVPRQQSRVFSVQLNPASAEILIGCEGHIDVVCLRYGKIHFKRSMQVPCPASVPIHMIRLDDNATDEQRIFAIAGGSIYVINVGGTVVASLAQAHSRAISRIFLWVL